MNVSVLGSLPGIVYSLICFWTVCQNTKQKETARQVAVGEGRLSHCVPGDCMWPN